MSRYEKETVLSVLNELEQISKREYLPSIGPIKGRIISDIIRKYEPDLILEIGTLHGYSAILMGSLLPNGGKLITLEVNKNLADIARKNIEKAGMADKIEVVCGIALEIIPSLTFKFDLVFLDATKSEYFRYLKQLEASNIIKENAIVIADNVKLYENEMADYLEYVRTAGMYKSQTTETTLEFNKNVEDALEISIRLEK
jgi:predicted O-methyltransferase YrrM